MGLLSNLLGNTKRETHKDGSYTDSTTSSKVYGTSTTYNPDGTVREYTIESNPLLGLKGVTTYDKDGKKTNWQSKK